MTTNELDTVSVHILDKEFRLSCPPGADQELRDAAHYLDSKMREIRKSGRVIGIDRIAVMAALNVCHELLTSGQDGESNAINSRIQVMGKKIDTVLQNTQNTISKDSEQSGTSNKASSL